MPKFKVGDKIRRIKYDSQTVKIGQIYTVSEIIGSNLRVKELDHIGRISCDSENFELVIEEPSIQINPKENMGIRLNSGKPRWRNFPMFLMEPVIRVGSHAEKRFDNPNGKYETFNFLKGMYVNDCLDSLKRHLMKFESPYESDNDEETQESHLAHIAWNALVALHMLKTRPELDDRYKIDQKPELTDQEKGDAAIEIQKRGR